MANLSPSPKLQFFDANGVPLVGGKLYSYAAGTTTPLATYTSSAETTFNTNPIILNSRGEAEVWLGSPQYKFKLTTAADVEIWTVDNIGAPTIVDASVTTAKLADAAVTQAKMAFNIYQQIQRQTVTSASAIDFTIPSGFTDFEVTWALTFSADAQIGLRSSVDGTTFSAGGSDYQQAYILNSGASGSNIGSTASAGITICAVADANSTGTGSFKFTTGSGFRVQGATSMVFNAAGAQWEQGIAAGVRNSGTVPLAFRMYLSSGTVTGTVTLRGAP